MIAETTQAAPRPSGRWLPLVVRFREVGIILFIVVLSALVSLRSPAFLSAGNFNDILLNISILVIVALAQAIDRLRR